MAYYRTNYWKVFGIALGIIAIVAGLFFLGIYIADVCNPDMTYVEILQAIFGITKETATETPTEDVENVVETSSVFLKLVA